MSKTEHVILIPDSGPLLELAHKNKLDDLFVTFASLAVPDAVVHELLRATPEEGKEIALWISSNNIPIFDTRIFAHGQGAHLKDSKLPQGMVVDLCMQEIMNEINLSGGKTTGVFLLDEHKCIGKNTFLLADHCKAVTLKAFERFMAASSAAVVSPETTPSRVVPKRPKKTKQPELEKPELDKTMSVSEINFKPEVKKDVVEGILLSARDVANPKLVEKRLRELAGQTVNLSRKTIDAFKSRNQNKPEPPDAEAIEQFRKNLV